MPNALPYTAERGDIDVLRAWSAREVLERLAQDDAPTFDYFHEDEVRRVGARRPEQGPSLRSPTSVIRFGM